MAGLHGMSAITPFDYCIMFFSSFLLVFLLGIQSKNVNQSRYVSAVVTSFGISLAQFFFVKYAAAGDYAVFFTCAAGGCIGIAFSIWFYDNVLHRRRSLKNIKFDEPTPPLDYVAPTGKLGQRRISPGGSK